MKLEIFVTGSTIPQTSNQIDAADLWSRPYISGNVYWGDNWIWNFLQQKIIHLPWFSVSRRIA